MSFKDDLSIAGEMAVEITNETRTTALKFVRNVVLATPVDTGRARANWQASEDRPERSKLAVNDKGGGVTINLASSTILKSSPYPVFWVSNNLPYIVPLNNGSSKQAPKKFVETAIKLAQR